jgi:hypothetical protein
MKRNIFIDPSYSHFLDNGLFNLNDPVLNRDGQLLPFFRAKSNAQATGDDMVTADLLSNLSDDGIAEYYSLGLTTRLDNFIGENKIKLKAFVVLEPPIVAPHLYKLLPRLTKIFEKVYLHNAVGDGYSLVGVETSKLHRFYWPLPYHGVLIEHWASANRLNKIVVINGNHKAWFKKSELYSMRINAMVELNRLGCIDLFGRGWADWRSRNSMWPPYFINLKSLMSIYKGACESKYNVLSKYAFCLCVENMKMSGYISEKIFDCFYTGVIPIYFGAPDITDHIPSTCFIDRRNFSSWTEAWKFAYSLSEIDRQKYRDSAREFMHSNQSLKYYNSIDHIVESDREGVLGVCSE